MATELPTYRRLVLGLQPNVPDSKLRIAAKLANTLQIELLGLFLADRNLRDLAQMPFAREFRGAIGGWQPIDTDRIAHDLELASSNLKRIFEQVTQDLQTVARFEVAHGLLSDSVTGISRPDDIFVVIEPASPAERATSQFAWLIEAAFRSSAAVLLLPWRICRTRGPIVAIATEPDDASVDVAVLIATAAKEDLVVISADNHRAPALKLAAEAGLKVKQITASRRTFVDPAACADSFRHLQERMVVMSRKLFPPSVAIMIAAERQIPVLVIEPDTPTGSRGEQTSNTTSQCRPESSALKA